MNELKNFTNNQLVNELISRPETEVIIAQYKDNDEFYFGDMDYFLEGKGIVLIVGNKPRPKRAIFEVKTW